MENKERIEPQQVVERPMVPIQDKMLGLKRQRILDMYEAYRDNLLVYLDYWIEKEKLHPIAIRIWNRDRDALECYLFDIKQDMLTRIKSYYGNRNKTPYWVSYISDSVDSFVIAMANHYEKYDISWITSIDIVEHILQQRCVKLFTIFNHAQLFEHRFNCCVTSVRYIKSEDAYKVDFIKTYVGDAYSSVEINNVSQAISSLKTKITKTLNLFPYIKEELYWKELGTYFR